MRYFLLICLLAIASAAPSPAPDAAVPSITLYRNGEKELSADAKAKLADWTLGFLKTSDLNTANQSKILSQSVTTIQKHYRETVRGDFLVMTFNKPTTLTTVGGDLTVNEIIVGLNRPDEFPSALFDIDQDGRVVAHEMYRGTLPDILQPKRAMTESAIKETAFRIGLYAAENHHLPHDLAALPLREGHFNRINDLWNRPLIYTVDGDDKFTLGSLGQDGVAGGNGDDADISVRFQVKDGKVARMP
jgi:hypothetical protein